jgi:GNAT superfamily N-acetyltransferase
MGGPGIDTPTGTAGWGVERASLDDAHRLGQLIADAFADLEQNLWLVPDVEARGYVFPAYFTLHVELSIHYGMVHTTPQRDAVAVWLPVDGAVPTVPDYDIRLERLAGSWAHRFHTFETILATHHPVQVRHEFLAFLAVHPSRQRWGLGTRLLEHHHRTLDEHGLPAYLEAASWHSYDFYRGHGWRDYADPFLVARDGPAMYPMWREPQPAGGGRQ